MGDWKILNSSGSFLDMEIDLGFKVQQMPGVGMPPVQNIDTPYGLLDGALFQRTRSDVRTFSLVGVISGSSTQDLLTIRQNFIDLVRPDRETPQANVVVQYSGGDVTKQASVIYDGGLEIGNVNVFTEQGMAIRFKQYDPYWDTSASDGAVTTSCTLVVNSTLANANYFVFRNAEGDWSRVEGASSAGVEQGLYATSDASGVYWLGLGRSDAGNIAYKWGGEDSTASTFGASTANVTFDTEIREIKIDANNNKYLCGAFNSISSSGLPLGLGDGMVGNIVQYDGTNFFPMGGGVTATKANPTDISNQIVARIYGMDFLSDGRLVCGGNFDQAGSSASVSACNLSVFNPSASTWGSLYGGASSYTNVYHEGFSNVSAVEADSNDNIFTVGRFTVVSSSVAASRFAILDQGAGEWRAGGLGFDNSAFDIAIKSDGTSIITGCFANTGDLSQSMQRVAKWNGTKLENLSASTGGASGYYFNTCAFDSNDLGYVGGRDITEVGGITLSDPIAVLSGTDWQHLDGIELPGSAPRVRWIYASASDTVIICHDQTGNALVSGKTTINNGGNNDVFPILTVSGSGNFTHFKNYTTGDNIFFNISLLAGETTTLDLRPGKKTFTSDARGNIIGHILPSSNVATFKLQPGNNEIAFFHNNTTASATLDFTERYWGL